MKILTQCPKVFFNTQKLIKNGSFKILQRNYAQSSDLSYIHRIGRNPLIYRTLGQELSRAAEEYGDGEYLKCVEENKVLTYMEVKSEADRLAAGFQCLGLEKGDRVGIWAPNVAMWPIVMFAAARAGLILVALNPAYEAPEMEYCIQKVGVKALVASESFRQKDYYDKLLEIIPEVHASDPGRINSKKLPQLTTIIINSERHFPGTFRLNDVGSLPTPSQISAIEDQQKYISPDSGCNIQFTSGTTGRPKATFLKHLASVNNNLRILEIENRRICVQVPLFHQFGMLMGLVFSMFNKSTAVIPSIYYNSEDNLHAIKNEKCTVIIGTPTMFTDLVNKQHELNLSINAEFAITAGALCTTQLFQEMKEKLGLKKVKTLYGLTEGTTALFATFPNDDYVQVLETVGHVQDSVEAKVIDPQGNLVPFGTPGELCVRGYFTMLGYWGDEEKTRETLGSDGWLRTGDQFIIQSDGYGKVVGRLKEMIIRGGENIFPKEIENFLATCPQIAEVYVVGVPDERLGEEMCAFVRLRAGCESFTAQEVRDFCKGKIAHFKIPRYIEMIEEFPKTLSGKIQKFKLQQQFTEKCNKK